MFQTEKTVTIVEAIIPFKGRFSFKQYIKDKPTKWGMKISVPSGANNGFVYRFQIYAGKRMVRVLLCSRVVLELMEVLEIMGLKIIITIPAHNCF